MKASFLLAAPLLAAGVLATGTTHQYDISIRGSSMAVVAHQSPQGVHAQSEIRGRSVSARVSVTTSDTAGGRAVAAVVDTMVTPPPPAAGPNTRIRGGESATGATWRGVVAGGRAPNRMVAAGSMSARQLDETVLFLVPSLPAEIAPGATWADTSNFEITAGESQAELRIFSDYHVTGGDAQSGFHVAREFRAERTSRSKHEQGETLMESRATGRADYELDGDGAVVSMRLVRDVKTDMHLPQVDRVLTAATTDTTEVKRRS